MNTYTHIHTHKNEHTVNSLDSKKVAGIVMDNIYSTESCVII